MIYVYMTERYPGKSGEQRKALKTLDNETQMFINIIFLMLNVLFAIIK